MHESDCTTVNKAKILLSRDLLNRRLTSQFNREHPETHPKKLRILLTTNSKLSSFSTSNMANTRTSNAKQHPGKVVLDQKQKRRTRAEIEAARKEEEVLKKANEVATKRKYQRITEMEDKMAGDDEKEAKAAKIPRSRRVQSTDLEIVEESDKARGLTPLSELEISSEDDVGQDNLLEVDQAESSSEDEPPVKKKKGVKEVRNAILAERKQTSKKLDNVKEVRQESRVPVTQGGQPKSGNSRVSAKGKAEATNSNKPE